MGLWAHTSSGGGCIRDDRQAWTLIVWKVINMHIKDLSSRSSTWHSHPLPGPCHQQHLGHGATGKAGQEEGDSVARRGGNVPFEAGAQPRSTDCPEELMARADAAIKEHFQPEGDGKVQEGGEGVAQTADMQAEEDTKIGKQQLEAPTAEQVDA